MRYHFIGIGGTGMSALAGFLLAKGDAVSGSDVVRNGFTQKLEAEGARIFYGHDVKNIGNAEIVIYSHAVDEGYVSHVYESNKGYTQGAKEFIGSSVINKSCCDCFSEEKTGDSNDLVTDNVKLSSYNNAVLDSVSNNNGFISNPELCEAVRRGVKIVSREELLAEIFNGYGTSIAVAGMHGKTTVSAMLAWITARCGLSPDYFIGGELCRNPLSGKPFSDKSQESLYCNTVNNGDTIDKNGYNALCFNEKDFYGKTLISNKNVFYGANYGVGNGKACIAEACEYKRSFTKLEPSIAVVLNMDLDHTDCFKDIDDVYKAYGQFVSGIKCGGKLIAHESCRGRLPFDAIYFGEGEDCDFRAKNLSECDGRVEFDVFYRGAFVVRVKPNIYGRHNVSSVLAAFAVSFIMGLPVKEIACQLESFCGVKRRFERKIVGGVEVIEDYAHHPEQVKAVIRAIRSMGYGRITAVFQPHTYSRTLALMERFSTCFDGVDKLILLPVYAAREKVILGGRSTDLLDAVHKNGRVPEIVYVSSFSSAADMIKWDSSRCNEIDLCDNSEGIERRNSITLILGAGDVYKVTEELLL